MGYLFNSSQKTVRAIPIPTDRCIFFVRGRVASLAMKKSNHNHRPALTAIAAVVASSTFVASTVPAAAQETAALQTVPVQTAPAQAVPVEAPVQIQSIASVTAPAAPVAAATPPVSQISTAPIMAPRREVVQPLPPKVEVPTEEPKAEMVTQAAASTATKIPARKVTAKPAVKARNVAAPASHADAVAPAAVMASAPAVDAANNDTINIVDEAAAAAIVAEDTQIVAETASNAADTIATKEAATTSEVPTDGGDILPWALGLFGLGVVGGAAALRRRKSAQTHYDEPVIEQRRAAEAPIVRETVESVDVTKVEAEPEITAPVAPIATAGPMVTPSMSDRFREPAAFAEGVGYHESIVDEGPTPENPFQTRKARLKRARYLDRIAAENGTQPVAPVPFQASKHAATDATRTVTFGSKSKVDA